MIKRHTALVGIVTISVLLGFSVAFAGYQAVFNDRIFPNVTIGSIEVGGLTTKVAVQKVQAAVDGLGPIAIKVDGNERANLTAADLHISYDVSASVQNAQSLGRLGTWGQQMGQRLWAMFHNTIVAPTWTYDENEVKKVLKQKVFEPSTDRVQEVSIAVAADGSVSVLPGKSGMVLDEETVTATVRQRFAALSTEELALERFEFMPRFTVDDAADAVTQAKQIIASPLTLTYPDGSIELSVAQLAPWITSSTVILPNGDAVLAAAVKTELVEQAIKTFAFDQINRDPADAKVRFADGRVEVFQPSTTGLTVDVAVSTTRVSTALLQRTKDESVAQAELQVAVVEPAIDSTKLADLGIKELIGRAATDYATSPANRKHNINVGAQKMSGIILRDGEEFSAVKALGAVDASTGYLPELVISGNKLEREYGGGLCQPITTLFRAVLDAGLPITDRTNHSRRVAYYEKQSNVKGVRIDWNQQYANNGGNLVGYDATVYIPAPDLKFKNDTGHAILVQAVVTNNSQVTFELYGTNDGRTVSISKATFSAVTGAAGPQFVPDPTKPSGTTTAVEKPVPGAKTSFDYIITYPDQRVESQTFTSYYRPIAGQYLVGTAEPVPVAEPVPTPTP